ncbi:MAG: TonB-dependent receptor [Sandaracinus sp.]|nr:TonB-dependent receptor [Sandaracinus sp.]
MKWWVPLIVLAVATPVSAQRRVTPSRLWNEPTAPADAASTRVDGRGVGTTRTRGGLDALEGSLDRSPWRLDDGSAEMAGDAHDAQERSGLRLAVEDELRVGFSNVDRERLLADYPTTLPEELLGGRGGVRNLLRLRLEGPLGSDDLSFAYEGVDDRLAWQRPLGSTTDARRSRPRHGLALRWRASETTELTVGGRFDADYARDAALDAWTLRSAGTEARADLGTAYATLRTQPSARHELRVTYGFEHLRDDVRSREGVGVAGHYNLDSFQRWGNAAWTIRRRQTRHHVDAAWRIFAGALGRSDAHTLTLGAQLDAWRRRDDETRNGGHTFVDALALDGETNRLLDENDRNTWELDLSDRGDELHGGSRTDAIAAYVEDHLAIGDRVDLFAGVRIEHTRLGAEGERGLLRTTTASPRAELWWTATRDRFTRFFVQYGRFHPSLDPRIALRDPRAAAYSPLEYWRWTGDPGQTPLPEALDPRWARDETFGTVVGRVDPNARHPYVDRLAGGMQTKIPSAHLAWRVAVVHERHRRPLALYDAGYDREPSRYRLEEETFGPGERDRVSYLSLAPGTRPEYVVGNAPGAFRNVTRLDLATSWDPADALAFSLRYRFVDDRGNLDDRGPLSLDWRDASNRAPSRGRTPNVDRHRLDATLGLHVSKLSFFVDYGLRAGARYSRVALVRPEGQQRTFVYDAARRGGYVYPTVHRLDLRAQVRIPAASGEWKLWVEARNVLGAGTPTAFREVSSAFRSVARLQDPFELRVGARHVF